MVRRARGRCRELTQATWQTLPLEDAGAKLGAVGHLVACLNVITSPRCFDAYGQWNSLVQLVRPGGHLLVVVPSFESARHVAEQDAEAFGGTLNAETDLIRRCDTEQKHLHPLGTPPGSCVTRNEDFRTSANTLSLGRRWSGFDFGQVSLGLGLPSSKAACRLADPNPGRPCDTVDNSCREGSIVVGGKFQVVALRVPALILGPCSPRWQTIRQNDHRIRCSRVQLTCSLVKAFATLARPLDEL